MSNIKDCKMKKLFLLAAAAPLMLASCSNDDPTVNNGREIKFLHGMSSRAVETTEANLTNFKVTAMLGDANYFTDLEFTKDGETNTFTSSKLYYWPGDNSELKFYAYAPASLSNVTINKDSKTVANFAPATTIKDQVDFVSAIATGTKKGNEGNGVNLSFNHNLAQIEIQGKSSNDVYKFEITGVKIANPISQGSFDFGTNEWTPGSSKYSYVYTYENKPIELTSTPVSLMDYTGTPEGEMSGNAMLIPQQLVAWVPDTINHDNNSKKGAYIAVRLKITTKDTGVQIFPFVDGTSTSVWAAVPISTKWEKGKKYTYILDFTNGGGRVDPDEPVFPDYPILGKPIKFTVKVTDWAPTTNENKDMDTNK